MADTYEQWRDADRKAHEVEQRIRSLGRRSHVHGWGEEFERAKQLRAEADKLFDAAICDINARVNAGLAK
jgi:hypothetical protein